MIIELRPHISKRIWGGTKLNQYKQIPLDLTTEPVGETWEVSTHKDGISKIAASNELLSNTVDLKYLIKFLDTDDVLSVQVHPNDEYSKIHENQKGKFECWIILEAQKDAGIFLGFKKGKTKKHLQEYLEQQKNVSELLNFYPVKPGEFFVVPPGTIHAIGKGVTLVEVQQSSGVTYRVWDWNRVDSLGNPRELHVLKALDVLVDDEACNTNAYFQYTANVFEKTSQTLISHEDFNLKSFSLGKNENLDIKLNPNLNYALIILKGNAVVGELNLKNHQSFLLSKESEIKIAATEELHFILVC